MKYRLYLFLAGLVLGLPVLLLNLSVFGTAGSVERLITGKRETTTVPGGLVDLGNSLNGLWGDHKDANQKAAIFDRQALTRQRTVTITHEISIDTVLAEGETPPDPDFDSLYIIARAPAHAMKDCPLMLETIAETCSIGRTEVDKKSSGQRLLTSTFGYAPAYPMGDLSVIDAATVEVEPVNLLSPDRTIQLPVAERADYRKSVYANALTACQTLRNRVGSCVIKSLNIKEQPDTKQPGFVRVSATARLAWLKHDGLSDDVIAGLDLQPNVPQTDVASADSDAPRLGPLATILNILQRAPETASAPPEAPKEGPRILRGGNAFRPAGDAAFRSVGGG